MIMKGTAMRMMNKAMLCMGMGIMLLLPLGCGSQDKNPRGFFTSGNREADQRAEQRIAKAQQINPEQNKNANEPAEKSGGLFSSDKKNEKTGAAVAPNKETLYGRLGGADGIRAIVDDFVARAMADPRVNWKRKGVTRGGWGFHRNDSIAWNPSDAEVNEMKKHIVQFLSVATGGPTHYDGKEIKQAHQGMHIANAEFDAAIGDLKATLDKLAVPTAEQKELLAIMESTRQQIVEKR
jgi:hemoglobin